MIVNVLFFPAATVQEMNRSVPALKEPESDEHKPAKNKGTVGISRQRTTFTHIGTSHVPLVPIKVLLSYDTRISLKKKLLKTRIFLKRAKLFAQKNTTYFRYAAPKVRTKFFTNLLHVRVRIGLQIIVVSSS